MGMIEDIPKLYTALAEWLACFVFVILLKRRWSFKMTSVCCAVSLLLLAAVQYYIGIAPLWLWIPGMIVALGIMYGTIFLCCRVLAADAGFYLAIAFNTAEFAASLDWQLYSFAVQQGYGSHLLQAVLLFVCYGGAFYWLFRMEHKRLTAKQDLQVSVREMLSAAVVAVGAFLISNISYVNPDTPLSGRMSIEIFYIRTLVDFAGVIMLSALQDRWQELQAWREVEAINSVLQRQYEQYCQSRENIEIINRKYHDLKHQIGIIRMEQDARKREEYLCQMESGIEGFAMEHQTGNAVLDTILNSKQMYCVQHQINLNVVADGEKLDFMDAMSLCSIFGNALDNAIESVELIPEQEKRLIRLAVYTQNQFLMIRVENYFETDIQIEGGELQTTKGEKNYHGYGIKSIRYAAEQYDGSIAVNPEGNWFSIKVLIPLPEG